MRNRNSAKSMGIWSEDNKAAGALDIRSYADPWSLKEAPTDLTHIYRSSVDLIS